MERFFSLVGKVTLTLLVIGLLVGSGYYVGKRAETAPEPTTAPPAPSETMIPTEPASPSAEAVPFPQVLQGGGISGLSFSAYTVAAPSGWTVKRTATATTEAVTISRDNYTITIYQAATGGAQCVYPGETGSEMATAFGPYATIHDGDGREYRRATPATSTSGFTVCQKSQAIFGLPTAFGHITYQTPAVPDADVLTQMDAIFGTLKKR